MMRRIPLVIGWQERVRSNLQRHAKLTVRFVWKGVTLPNWHTYALLLFLFHHQVDKRLSKEGREHQKNQRQRHGRPQDDVEFFGG